MMLGGYALIGKNVSKRAFKLLPEGLEWPV
jgi:hypothetical protein